jgi:hypothetical protein
MMAGPHSTGRAEELRREQDLLVKSELDIEQGWARLRGQQDLVDQLQGSGRDIAQAERLVNLLKQTLIEWERHRRLIEQRVAYLEREISRA